MENPRQDAVTWLTVDESGAGQRIDNFLLGLLKGVPKSHVYRILRSGEVRVNSGRVAAEYRLKPGERLRIPPIRVARPPDARPAAASPSLALRTLFEDSALLAIDKPAGLAVHGGSGVSYGTIEALRAQRPELKFLELVHRLDKETSGVLLLAKKRSALTTLHEAIREGRVDKRYLALVAGRWSNRRQAVKLALTKYLSAAGERRVAVDADGQAAHTVFSLVENINDFSLLEAELKTGRTHQIRVHLAHLGFPIVGDEKYGDFALNKRLAREGVKGMFLHAARLSFAHPLTGESLELAAPPPESWERFMRRLRSGDTGSGAGGYSKKSNDVQRNSMFT